MNQNKLLIFALFFSMASFVPAQAQDNQSSESKFGIGFDVGLQKPYCDVQHTGAGTAFEMLFKYVLNNRFSVSLSAGAGELNDGFIYKSFTTNIINADLKANFNLLKSGKFNPYIFIGTGLVSFEYHKAKVWAIGSSSVEGERKNNGMFIYGGGIEYFATPNFALNAFADYRFTTTDLLDGAQSGDYKDGYVNTRVGFTFYMGKGRAQGARDEDLFVLEPVEMDQLESTEDSEQERLSQFDEKMDQFEMDETQMTMENYVRLKSRVDELNRLIAEKEDALEELQSELLDKNSRISELQTRVSSGNYTSYTDYGSSDFSDQYEQGLRLFYSRDYVQAIDLFQQLKSEFPAHKLASNCQYWVGECYFGLNEIQNATQAFHNVFNYDFSYKKDDATLMLGRCYLKLNDIARARSYFQGVIDEYPNSEYVEKAQQWLQRI